MASVQLGQEAAAAPSVQLSSQLSSSPAVSSPALSTGCSTSASWFRSDGQHRSSFTSFEVREAHRERTESLTKAEYMESKLKYHRRLSREAGSAIEHTDSGTFHRNGLDIRQLAHPPLHVLTRHFFVRLPFGLDRADSEGRQGSIGFIFTIVTTMMGATIVSVPWGFQQAGVGASLGLLLFFGFIAYYTCTIILDLGSQPGNQVDDFSEVCENYLGSKCRNVANVTSIFILWGATMCFHVLIASLIQSVVLSVANDWADKKTQLFFCCGDGNYQYSVTSVIVGAIVLPFLAVDISKLAKVASYGFISLVYNCLFLVVTSLLNMWELTKHPSEELEEVKVMGGVSDVGTFVGMIGLALFVHSMLLPVANNHVCATTSPATVRRDLGIAYFIAISIYIAVGALPAVAFQLGHGVLPNYMGADQLPQNILLGYRGFPVGALIGRMFIAMQLCIVYPILASICRKQVFAALFGTEPAGLGAILFNVVFVGFGTVVAAVYPKPGQVVGYVGAYTAVVYLMWLPILVQLSALQRAKQLTWWSAVGNLSLAIVGTGIVMLQFV